MPLLSYLCPHICSYLINQGSYYVHDCSPLGLCSWSYSLLAMSFSSPLPIKNKTKTTDKKTCCPSKANSNLTSSMKTADPESAISSVFQPLPCGSLRVPSTVFILTLRACLIPTTTRPCASWRSWSSSIQLCLPCWAECLAHNQHAIKCYFERPRLAWCKASLAYVPESWSCSVGMIQSCLYQSSTSETTNRKSTERKSCG